MSVLYTSNDFTSGKGILVFPDHYVAVPQLFAKDHALAVTVGTRKIVKAGTPYPANDATAIGVVFHDIDVTDGDETGAILIHAFVATAKLPVIVAAAAKTAMKGLQFLPVATPDAPTLSCTKAAIDVGEVADTTFVVEVKMANQTFRPEAATKTNWTFVGEAGTKVSVDSVTVSADATSCLLTLKVTAAAVAGDITANPKAAAVSLGTVPAVAATVATVA
jgi:hypothetical protein